MAFKENKIKQHRAKARIISIMVLAFVLFLLGLLENYPQVIERYYTQGLYRLICKTLHPVFNLFPFSVGDVLYLTVIVYMVYCFGRLIILLIKREFKPAGVLALGMIISVQAAMLVFYVLWGINYFRPSAAERLKLPDSDYTTAQLASLTSLLIDSANATRARVTQADMLQSNSSIRLSAIKAVKVISACSADFRTYSPNVKLSLFTPLLNYIGTSGYYDPFTTEAQMNYQMPVFLRPFVACHEMSHQMGYGPEDEANFAGFLAGIRSTDRLLRYSAYHEGVDECMRNLMLRDSVLHKQLRARVSPAVHQDFVNERDFWLSHISKVNAVTDIFYDHFLKANNQPQGMLTYNRMIRLVMAWYTKEGLLHNNSPASHKVGL